MTISLATIEDFRNALALELNKLHAGQTTAASANAFANLSGKILSSIKIEMEYNKALGKTPCIEFIDSNQPKAEIKQLGDEQK